MSDFNLRSHGAHSSNFENCREPDFLPGEHPSQLLCPKSEHVCAILEELDDVIFFAITGDVKALAEARTLWPKVVAEIGWELVEESREQYLRYAINVTQRFENEGTRTPKRAIAALEIISLLTEE